MKCGCGEEDYNRAGEMGMGKLGGDIVIGILVCSGKGFEDTVLRVITI